MSYAGMREGSQEAGAVGKGAAQRRAEVHPGVQAESMQ